VNECIRRTVKFLEKEINTYQALSLFLSKKEIREHVSNNQPGAPIDPTYYKARMKEAKQLVADLKKSN